MKRKITSFLTVLFFTGLLQAAIVQGTIGNGRYTDWSNEESTQYGLDFNNDGQIDFSLNDDRTLINFANFTTENGDGNNVWTKGTFSDFTHDQANPLSLKTIINESGNWNALGDCMLQMFDTPYLPLNEDSYMGFRIKINNNFHYGWAKVLLKENGSDDWGKLYLAEWKEIYYETEAGKSIEAGFKEDTYAGISNNSNLQFSILPNPFLDRIEIAGLNGNENISIVDITGIQRVFFSATEQTMEIEVSNLPIGIYFISVKNNSKTETFKVIKK